MLLCLVVPAHAASSWLGSVFGAEFGAPEPAPAVETAAGGELANFRNDHRLDGYVLPPECIHIALDVGVNNGADSLALLKHGLCVIGVEANPKIAAKALDKLSNSKLNISSSRYKLYNMGVAEIAGTLPFYSYANNNRNLVENTVSVPTQTCNYFWRSVPTGVRPTYLKVDVEEYHYVCIEALARLPAASLPSYVSWEMHEIARGLPYPVLDAHLIALMRTLGYEQIKLVSNACNGRRRRGGADRRGDFSGGQLPEDVVDAPTNSTRWRPVQEVLSAGLGWPRRGGLCGAKDWLDFHMKLKTQDAWPPERLG